MLTLRLAGQLVTVLTVVLVTRLLGPAEFGRYAYLFGLLTIFTLLNVNGLNDILVREIASHPDERNRIWRAGLALKIPAAGTAYLAAMAVILGFRLTDFPAGVVLAAGLTIWVSLSQGSFRLAWDVPYQIDFRMAAASALNLAGRLLFLGGLMAWTWRRSDPTGATVLGLPLNTPAGGVTAVVIMQVAAETIATTAQGWLNRRLGYPIAPRWEPALVKHLLREVWPLAVSGAFVALYSRINLPVLKFFLSEREVGIFAAPQRLVDALLLLPTIILIAAAPVLASHPRFSPAQKDLAGLVFRVLLAVGMPLAAVVTFYSAELVEFFYGLRYAESAAVLAILIWSGILNFCVLGLAQMLIVTGGQKVLMAVYGFQTVVNVVLNLLLVPRYGATGAGAAAVLTMLSAFPAVLPFARWRWISGRFARALPIPLAAAVLSAWTAHGVGLPWLAAAAVVPVIFAALNWWGRGFSKVDLDALCRLWAARAGSVYGRTAPPATTSNAHPPAL